MTLPPIFAITTDETITVFDAIPYDYNKRSDHPTYLITPHRFYQRDNLPSFTIQDRPTNVPHVAKLSTNSSREQGRRIIFHGECRPSEASVYTIYHPDAIPIYQFEERVEWPTHHDSVLRVFPGDRIAYRFWLNRWDPSAVFEEYTSVRNRYAPAVPSNRRPTIPTATATTATTAAAAATAATAAPIPKFVVDALISDAITKAAICPITMEPIKSETAAVTPCYHCFDKIALASWIATGNTTCPTCKQSIV
jgi:hypothetical protein